MDRVLRWLPLLFFGLALCLPFAGRLVAEPTRTYFVGAAICAWYALAVAAPVLWLCTGSLRSKTGVSTRDQDPFGYWGGVVTWTAVVWAMALGMHWVLRHAP
jgi:hypothetical protein